MGFPVVCTAVTLPTILIEALSVIEFIRTLICSFLVLMGLLEPGQLVRADPPGSSSPAHVSVSKIREMLPEAKFSEVVAGAGDKETPESCAVCLHEFEAEDEIRRLRNCRHVFHRLCVDRWMDHGQMTCPLCRTPFVMEMQCSGERIWPDVYGDYNLAMSLMY